MNKSLKVKNGKEYWDAVRATADRVKTWPEWKTGAPRPRVITDDDWQRMYKRLLDAGHGSRIHTHEDGIKVNVGDVVAPVWVRLNWNRACRMLAEETLDTAGKGHHAKASASERG